MGEKLGAPVLDKLWARVVNFGTQVADVVGLAKNYQKCMKYMSHIDRRKEDELKLLRKFESIGTEISELIGAALLTMRRYCRDNEELDLSDA